MPSRADRHQPDRGRGRASRRARHRADGQQRPRAAVVEVDGLGVGDARRPAARERDAPQRRHCGRARRSAPRRDRRCRRSTRVPSGAAVGRLTVVVVRVSLRTARSRPDHDDVLRLVEIARVVPRGRGEQMPRVVPRHVPVLAVAVGELRGAPPSSVGDEHVRGRIHRVAACRRCGSAAARVRCATTARPRRCVRARAPCRRCACRRATTPGADAARAWRAVTGLPTPSGWSVSCRAAPPQPASRTAGAGPARRAAGTRCAAVGRPARRAVVRAVGEAFGRRGAVGRRDEQFRTIGRAFDRRSPRTRRACRPATARPSRAS